MAIELPSYPNPYDPANPVAPAYVWMSFLGVDLASNAGRIVLSVNVSEDNWQAQPLGTLSVALGQVFTPGDPLATPPVDEVRMKRLDELMQDDEFRNAFNMIGAKLYAEAVAVVPELKGGTVVMGGS